MGTVSQSTHRAPCKAPNLDCMEPDDLARYARAFRGLARYAELSAKAQRLRLRGEINSALFYERQADETYESLPIWARW